MFSYKKFIVALSVLLVVVLGTAAMVIALSIL